MSQPFNASNEKDTCLWCGRRFGPEKKHVDHGNRSTCCDAKVEEWREEVHIEWKNSIEHRTRYRCEKCGLGHTGMVRKTEDVPTGRRVGYYGSPHFCTKTCGFLFAESMATLGHKLAPKPKKKESA